MNQDKFRNEATALPRSGGGKRRKQTARAARAPQAEEELSRFFDVSLDLMCVAGFDGYFKRLNPAWTTCLGWTLEELQARPFEDFVHPDDRGVTRSEVGRLSEGDETILFENRYRHKDGSYRWLQWNARPVKELQHIYASAREVTRQRRLEREVLEILDLERERLGRELHDGLCQTLAGISALSAALSKRLAASSDPSGCVAAAEIGKLLSESITEARDLAQGLSPFNLKENGLGETLDAFARNVENRFRISCTCECDHPLPRLRHDAELHLFRIAQEAVNNALSHGRAKRIDISLSSRDAEGELSIRDDGIGVREAAANPDGIGMHTMAYRARLIGASVTVRRRTEGGTAVVCGFPVSDAAYGEKQDPGAPELINEFPNE